MWGLLGVQLANGGVLGVDLAAGVDLARTCEAS